MVTHLATINLEMVLFGGNVVEIVIEFLVHFTPRFYRFREGLFKEFKVLWGWGDNPIHRDCISSIYTPHSQMGGGEYNWKMKKKYKTQPRIFSPNNPPPPPKRLIRATRPSMPPSRSAHSFQVALLSCGVKIIGKFVSKNKKNLDGWAKIGK